MREGAGGAGGYFHGVIPPLRDEPRVSRLVVYVPAWYGRAEEWAHPKVSIVRCRAPTARGPRVAYEQLVLPSWPGEIASTCS